MKPRRMRGIRWSPELAYIVGLLATDGNLCNDGRHFNFTSKDLQLIRTFKKCLKLKNKIGLKGSGFSDKKYSYIQFGDVVLYKWLLEIGLTPQKSKTIGKLKIPNKYFFDFVRGCFDGDGSCYSYWDPRWTSSFMFYINFNSGSLSHLEWLRSRLKRILKINGHITFGNGAWRLNYAKREAKILFAKIYYKENLPCLKRKYEKLKNILRIDNKEANKLLKVNGRVVESVDTDV